MEEASVSFTPTTTAIRVECNFGLVFFLPPMGPPVKATACCKARHIRTTIPSELLGKNLQGHRCEQCQAFYEAESSQDIEMAGEFALCLHPYFNPFESVLLAPELQARCEQAQVLLAHIDKDKLPPLLAYLSGSLLNSPLNGTVMTP